MNIIDLATKSMQTAIKAVVDGIKTTTDETNLKVEDISAQIGNKDAGKVLKSKTFTENGIFTVPEGVTEVYITGGGAGGGGAIAINASSYFDGMSGGVTSFGSLLSLNGGGGGISRYVVTSGIGGVAGGPGGENGGNGSAVLSSTTGIAKGGNSGPYFGSYGQSSGSAPHPGGYCSGGGSNVSGGFAGGGGGGDFIFKRNVTVTPLTAIPITIGVGGKGATTSGFSAGNGGNGILTVEWWE